MPSTLALIGGAEFQRGNDQVDGYLIERAGGARHTRGVIIPAAAAREDPQRAASNGQRWFQSLGVEMEPVMIVDKASADENALVDQLRAANFFYLLGGDPRYLVETLRGSQAWGVILEKYHAGRAVVAGSSAGAMALCAWVSDFQGTFLAGLNLAAVPCTVEPHFHGVGIRRAWRESLPAGVRILGIAEKTGAVFDGSEWRVVGPGEVAVIERTGEARLYKNGERFKLA